jgi:hypothetical protein
MIRPLRRRTLVLGATGVIAAGAAVAGGSWVACTLHGPVPDSKLALLRLVEALDVPFDPRAIGAEVLARRGAPGLWDEFAARRDLAAIAARDCGETRRGDLAACLRADFARGDSVVVDRWVLARGEALLAGLAFTL